MLKSKNTPSILTPELMEKDARRDLKLGLVVGVLIVLVIGYIILSIFSDPFLNCVILSIILQYSTCGL